MIAIIDYGMGNLRSVQKGLERVGTEARIVSTPEAIGEATGLVLPGVGAFGDAMENLENAGLVDAIVKSVSDGVPFLGICLGLQLLFSQSEELGSHRGLDILPGQVIRFPDGQLVPQIGWNQIHVRQESPLLEGVPDGAFFYFVHSFYVSADRDSDVIAETNYEIDHCSIAGNDRCFGVQFHPEKSQDAGLRLLKNFAGMVA
ncbi:MAG: imidazole glycerol phosphate synthase subunit HisH [Rhodospirillaceae bacterium]|nr:imidazole glycerol phosphate synthase subunit HisH [Rhodospirillaceae bacterium]